jgi:UDP-glucuronate decarboxylase
MFDSSAHLLITGGTGFFGLALLRNWQAMGHAAPRVTVLSRNPDRFKSQHSGLAAMAEWAHGDVLDVESLPFGQRFTHVLHAATDSTFGPQLTPLERYTQIVHGTRNVLDLAVSSGATRFLLTSSGAIYGPQPPHMDKIPERHCGMLDPLSPNNAYSVAKLSAEHLCVLYQDRYGLETIIARCFAFVGPDLPWDVHFAIGNFIRDALSFPEIIVNGDGTPVRSYMDQRDLARWLCTLLGNGRAGNAYNVGSDEGVTINELAHLVRDLLAPEKRVRIGVDPTSQNSRNRYVPSITKARAELGLTLTHSLQEAIINTAYRSSAPKSK